MSNQFIGTWKLVSCQIKDLEDQIMYPYGQDAIGNLIYTAEGYMAATLMMANRPNFAIPDIAQGTPEEKAIAFQTYLTYCGKYEVQENRVTHHIEASLFPNWVGIDQVRFFEFGDRTLTLSTPPFMLMGKEQVGLLIWEPA